MIMVLAPHRATKAAAVAAKAPREREGAEAPAAEPVVTPGE